MNAASRMRRRAALATLFALGGAALAQTPQATSPVRIIVGSTPGTTPDVLARVVSVKLGERLGRPVVVENRTGASGWIGAEAVARAAPDGTMLLLAASTVAAGSTLQALPFSPVDDLTPVLLMGWSRVVLVVNPATGLKTVQDMITVARKALGKLNYGTPGTGTPAHLTGELFKVKSGTYLTHIPYRGTAGQVNGVLAWQV